MVHMHALLVPHSGTLTLSFYQVSGRKAYNNYTDCVLVAAPLVLVMVVAVAVAAAAAVVVVVVASCRRPASTN